MENPDRTSLRRNHIGIDFGRNLTVVARSFEPGTSPELVGFPGISRDIPCPSGYGQVPVIPSVIRYSAEGSCSLGEEATSPELTGSPEAIFRRMVYYLCENSPVLVSPGPGRKIGYQEAGTDFLTELVKRVSGESGSAPVHVTFTVPLNAPPHYKKWITGVAESAGIAGLSSKDIGCATVHGYGLPLGEDKLYGIIDANPDSIEVAIIVPEREAGVDSGYHSRVLGIASVEFGGLTVDSWIASDIISSRRHSLPEVERQKIFPVLLRRCSRARELLPAGETTIRIGDLVPAPEEFVRFTHVELARIFRDHGLVALFNRTTERAFSAAQVYGYDRNRVAAILMIGELSALPAFQEAVCEQFPSALVRYDRPLDAAARGAAVMNASEKIPIRADYALRYWDPVSREHRYRFLVRRGAGYPSAGQVARIVISAAYDGQTRLGIPLYRVGDEDESTMGAGLELVGSLDGGFRIAGPLQDCSDGCKPVPANQSEPTYLPASPPAQKGIPRFELTFTLDEQGYLCLTARDLVSGFLVKKSERVYRLI